MFLTWFEVTNCSSRRPLWPPCSSVCGDNTLIAARSKHTRPSWMPTWRLLLRLQKSTVLRMHSKVAYDKDIFSCMSNVSFKKAESVSFNVYESFSHLVGRSTQRYFYVIFQFQIVSNRASQSAIIPALLWHRPRCFFIE